MMFIQEIVLEIWMHGIFLKIATLKVDFLILIFSDVTCFTTFVLAIFN